MRLSSMLSNASEEATPTPVLGQDVPTSRCVRWEVRYGSRLLMTDLAVVAGAVFLAQYLRFGEAPLSDGPASIRPTTLSVLFALLWLTALAIFRTRSPRVIGGGLDEYRNVVSASFWTFGAIAIGALLFKLDIARGYSVLFNRPK